MPAVKVTLQTPLEQLHGVGPARARILEEVGFRNVAQLLLHLPYRYEDRRRVVAPADIAAPGSYTVTGRLRDVRAIRVRRRRFSLVRGVLHSDAGEIPVVWFNRPYLARQVDGETEYLLHGAVRAQGGRLELVNPSCEPAARARHSGRVAPVYSAIGKLGPAFFRRVFAEVLEDTALFDEIRDALPEELRRRYSLPTVGDALRQLHLPAADADVQALNERRSPAHLRLIYGEFLELQLELAILRSHEVRVREGAPLPDRRRSRATGRPRRAAVQAHRRAEARPQGDRRRPRLAATRCSACCRATSAAARRSSPPWRCVVAIESGLQGAFMAPTELLAEQHVPQPRASSWARATGSACSPARRRSKAARLRRDLADGRDPDSWSARTP